MHPMTSSNLHNAYGGESMAHMRYIIWAEAAEKEGFPNVGRLFQAVSRAELVHATNHFHELKNETGDALCASGGIFGLGPTSQNLQGGIDGETFEINEMYPAYLEVARFQGEKGAEKSFFYALSAEKTHAELYTKAKKAVDSTKKDLVSGPVHICPICGWTHEGELPEKCPVCGAKKSVFQTFA
ncbi:MAG: rubrerythrin family protein [Dehalococcoidia bacterium]|nr:rubrerythrin family protein [Dehalococcoidia bacterium]